MSGWDFDDFREQVAQAKERAALAAGRRRGKGPLCCFAKTADGAYRFRSRHDEARIKVEAMPTGFRFDWLSRGWIVADELMRAEVLLGNVGWLLPRRLTQDELAAVLVARDAWLERGGGRMVRPFTIGTPPAPSPAHGPTDGGGAVEEG